MSEFDNVEALYVLKDVADDLVFTTHDLQQVLDIVVVGDTVEKWSAHAIRVGEINFSRVLQLKVGTEAFENWRSGRL